MRAAIILLAVATITLSMGRHFDARVNTRNSATALLTEIDPPPGFSYALEPREFSFPIDHGAHSSFRSEWWYFTGNLISDDEIPFGFQFTIFRFAMRPSAVPSKSPWRTTNLYLGHLAISDINAAQFYSAERQARGALGEAGAQSAPPRVWIEDWSLEQNRHNEKRWTVRAGTDQFGIDFELQAQRPIVAQGDRGLSQKSQTPGNASYYYSIPRLHVSGKLVNGKTQHAVSGSAWFDHEWSTSALAPGQLGWDWFSLQLDDGRDLMFYQIRNDRGHADAASHGVLVGLDGSITPLKPHEIKLSVLAHWRSPASRARYPAHWRITIPSQKLDLEVTPRFADQEWRKNFTYWEGAVSVSSGSDEHEIAGVGYVELVGY